MATELWKAEHVEKMRAYRRDHYHRNKARYIAKQKRLNIKYRDENKRDLESLKYPCVICKESEFACIDFHHLGNKKFAMANYAKGGISKAELVEEAGKCVCLCSNCHRKLHAGKLALPAGIEPAPQAFGEPRATVA